MKELIYYTAPVKALQEGTACRKNVPACKSFTYIIWKNVLPYNGEKAAVSAVAAEKTVAEQ
ncbi:MAG: hypothetical protein J6J83_01975 [Oscillospiraceae bacterium]|nr:hypothetical protein [Oscillospiraceae bacterium]